MARRILLIVLIIAPLLIVGLLVFIKLGLALLGFILIAWVLAQVLRYLEGHPLTATPLDILQQRLARGEITLEQYRELKAELEAKRHETTHPA